MTDTTWPFKAARPGRLPAIVMFDPKFAFNVGAAVRAASCFGVHQVWVSGRRCAEQVWSARRIPREERMRGFRDVDIILDDQPLRYFRGAVPIAVELLPNSENLLQFDHPQNAVYCFGPEDGHVPESVHGLCHRRVFIPTRHCTNLGAAVYLVLYDRMLKHFMAGEEPLLPMGEVLARSRGWPSSDAVFEVV
jgi:tRNA(Leu) C34 or U34 (ribose-2'-O)-methylase TrmL